MNTTPSNYQGKLAIVCIHGLGENGLNTVRSLGRAGIPVVVIGIQGELNLAKYSKYCSRFEEINSFDKKQLLDKLFQLRDELTYNPILFFDNDYMLALLNDSEEVLKSKFKLTQGIKDFSFKDYQMKMADEADVNVPKTWKPKSWNGLMEMKIPLNIKLIAKPSQDEGKKPFKTIVASNLEKLIDLIKKKTESIDKIIIQEYIEGKQDSIWAVLGYYSSDMQFSPILTAVKYSMCPPQGGVMAIGKVLENNTLTEISKRYIRKSNYFGIFGLEFKYSISDGSYYFIEMSPRTEGFHNITKLIGIDLPLCAYWDLVLKKKPFYQKSNKLGIYSGYWINIRYFVESLVIQKSVSDLSKLFIALASKSQFQHFDIKDLKPFFVASRWYINTAWKHRIKKLIIGKMNG